jgi:hypothetical protein
MRVSAAPFAGHASGGRPAAAHIRDAELRGGHHGYAAKADDLQLKSEGRDFVYVGADDIYLCTADERLMARNARILCEHRRRKRERDDRRGCLDERNGATGPLNGPPQKWQFRQLLDITGGPGRTRTCNQTVMSDDGFPENTDKTDQ